MSVLSFATADDRPLALLANYSLHYVGDMPPLSADYFGIFADRIGGILGKPAPAFVGILSNGTSGDVNNINFGGPIPPKRDVGERSRIVAEAVGQAAKKAATTEYRSDITLAVAEKELEFKVRKPTAEELKRAEEILEKTKARELKGIEEIYARETVLIGEVPGHGEAEAAGDSRRRPRHRHNPVRGVHRDRPGDQEEESDETNVHVSLANGYNGYLPTPAQHALGGYETWRARSSYLEVNASDTITTTILELLTKVSK